MAVTMTPLTTTPLIQLQRVLPLAGVWLLLGTATPDGGCQVRFLIILSVTVEPFEYACFGLLSSTD